MYNTYIKHYAEENSLTHYGVKGMKWKHRKIKWKPYNIKTNLTIKKDEIQDRARKRSDIAFKTRNAAKDALYGLATRNNKTNYFDKRSGTAVKRGLDFLKKSGAFRKAYRTAFKTYTPPLKLRKKNK